MSVVGFSPPVFQLPGAASESSGELRESPQEESAALCCGNKGEENSKDGWGGGDKSRLFSVATPVLVLYDAILGNGEAERQGTLSVVRPQCLSVSSFLLDHESALHNCLRTYIHIEKMRFVCHKARLTAITDSLSCALMLLYYTWPVMDTSQ